VLIFSLTKVSKLKAMRLQCRKSVRGSCEMQARLTMSTDLLHAEQWKSEMVSPSM